MNIDPVLSVSGLSKSFRAVKAVRDVSLGQCPDRGA